MKHSLVVTILLVSGFVISQVIGLLVVNNYVDWQQTKISGSLTWKPLPSLGGPVERPQVSEGFVVWWFLIMIVIATLLFFFLVRVPVLWKVWYFLAVFSCLFFAFYAFVPYWVALGLSLVCTFFRLRHNFIVHNLSELFIYGGLVALFVDMIKTVFVASVLLVIISLYDMYSVWQSKHMIRMAKSQAKSGVFAGMMIPYSFPKGQWTTAKGSFKVQRPMAKGHITAKGKVPMAILGGGDVGFPLLFTSVVFKFVGWQALAIIPFSALSLLALLLLAKKNKFYPAMPFLTIGCFVGYLVVWLI